MSGEQVVVLSGDERKLVDAYRKAVEAAAKLPPEIDKAAKESLKAEKELAKFAEQTKKLTTSPVEKLRQETEKLTAAEKKGLLTKEEVIARQVQLRSELGLTKNANDGLTGSIIAGVTSYLSFHAIVTQLTAAFGNFREEQRLAAEELKQTVQAERELTQVADTPEKQAKIEANARYLRKQYGLSADEAGRAAFQAYSNSVDDQKYIDIIGRLSPIYTPASIAGALGKLPNVLRSKGLTSEQSLNAVIAGSVNSDVNMEELQAAIAQVSTSDQVKGVSGAETIAAAAQLAIEFKSPDIASTRLRTLFERVGRDGQLADLPLLEIIGALDDQPTRDRVLGDSTEAKEAYTKLAGMRERLARETLIIQREIDETGTAGDISQGRYEVWASSQEKVLERDRRIAEERRKLSAMEAFGSEETKNIIVQENLKQQANETGVDIGRRFVADTIAARLGWLLGSDTTLKTGLAAQQLSYKEYAGLLAVLTNSTSVIGSLAEFTPGRVNEIGNNIEKAAASLEISAQNLSQATNQSAASQRAQRNQPREG